MILNLLAKKKSNFFFNYSVKKIGIINVTKNYSYHWGTDGIGLALTKHLIEKKKMFS